MATSPTSTRSSSARPTSGWPTTSSSCACPASARCSEHDADVRATAEFVADRLRAHGLRARRGRRRPAATPSSMPTGCTPRARRRSWSTPTTTSSRSIRSTCGRGRRSSRWSRTAASTRVAPPTTRATSTPTCGPPGRGWRRAAGCRSTSRSSWRARRSPARTTSTPWIDANRDRLKADLAVISDTGFYEGNQPAITVGLRGLVYMQIDVTGSKLDLHSGSFGGNVQNPANALATIVARLKNDDGSVAVPGFYDEVRAADAARPRGVRAHAPRRERGSSREHGLHSVCGEPGYSFLERRGARPTLDVNGIWGGFQGEGSKTIIPAHAHAKVSCRLVADMDPRQDVRARARLRRRRSRPRGVDVTSRKINDGMWSLTPIDHPATQAAADVPRGGLRREAVLPARGRLDPGRRDVRARCWACRSCCSASPSPTTRPTRPTRACASTTSRAACARSCATGRSWPTPALGSGRDEAPALGTTPRARSIGWCRSAPRPPRP